MPTIAPPAKVLVSGANGYIALWIVSGLLERGFHVRGTVRSADKGEAVARTLRAKLPADAAARFEYAVVADIAGEGAFDEAVKGVDAVVHAAAVMSAGSDPEAYMKPAIGGNLGMLNSVLKHGQSVKRIVLTSTTGAILDAAQTGTREYTEADWNDAAVRIVREKAGETPWMVMYWASKVLAERAAWDFCNEHKAEVGWDFAAVHPSFVFGPTRDDPASMDDVGLSMGFFVKGVFRQTGEPAKLAESLNYVDVRDVAEGHIRALEIAAAGGERIMLSGRAARWQEWLDAASKLEKPLRGLTKGEPGAGQDTPPHRTYSPEKAGRVLNLRYRPLEETLRDIVADFRSRGWLEHLE